MQLPKNIMQIGEPDAFYRVYIEDYVYTYIRQIEKKSGTERKKIYLFGKKLSDSTTCHLYVYGAADSEKGILSVQHEFFPEFDILGILSIYRNSMEISLQNGSAFSLNGFFVFYEQNDAMQEFLVHNFQESDKNSLKENSESGQMPAIRQRKAAEYQNSRYEKGKRNFDTDTRFLYTATFCMGIIICIIAITSINRYDKMKGFTNRFLQALNMEEENRQQAKDTVAVTEPTSEENIYRESIYIEEIKETIPPESEAETETEIETQTETQTETETESEENIMTEYLIKSGDSLAKISRSFYGDDSKVKEICTLNGIENPDDIKQGQKILLP
ncbi:MAG: LysM peptidoglycan-binding domain-containing protein [Lachnospiraceae bacterium]